MQQHMLKPPIYVQIQTEEDLTHALTQNEGGAHCLFMQAYEYWLMVDQNGLQLLWLTGWPSGVANVYI